MTTAQSLIGRALRLNGALAAGEALAADEAADGLAALNDLLDAWQIERLSVYRIAEVTLAATGAASYTIGPGGDVDTTRPPVIAAARWRDGGIDTPMEVIERERWNEIADKATGGIPDRLWYDPAYPLGVVYPWPVPGSCTLALDVWHPLQTFATLTDALALPPGYARALAYALAIELAPEYGREPAPSVVAIAAQAKAALKRRNLIVPPAALDPVFGGCGFDIRYG